MTLPAAARVIVVIAWLATWPATADTLAEKLEPHGRVNGQFAFPIRQMSAGHLSIRPSVNLDFVARNRVFDRRSVALNQLAELELCGGIGRIIGQCDKFIGLLVFTTNRVAKTTDDLAGNSRIVWCGSLQICPRLNRTGDELA